MLSRLQKFIPPQLWAILKHRNVVGLLRFILILLGLVSTYAVLFQLFMHYEGQSHSWATGVYWTLTTMSTLGYGDITFVGDAGRLFSMVVLLSGIIFMLVLLPVTFIELFYEPWLEARARGAIPRRVPEHVTGHVLLTFYGPVATALIAKLVQFKYPYVVVLPEREEVTRLKERGIHAMYGDLNDPDTYERARVSQAALVATTRTDIANTSVVFTVRGLEPDIPIVATAREAASREILKLAGATRVLDLTDLMAQALARRAIGGKRIVHIIGRIDDLLIVEVAASHTSLVGQPFDVAQHATKISIVGFWARGTFEVGQSEHVVAASTVLVMAGTSEQLRDFEATCKIEQPSSQPVIIIGGGRVGRATGRALEQRGIDYRIVELLADRIRDEVHYIQGDASDKEVLAKAGIEDAATIIITPRSDETNIYLAIYCRLLRPDIQIVARSTIDRNIAALHRAGSDIVMSSASMGANALFNLLERSDLLMIAEGLDVFKVPVPARLAGKSLIEANIRHLSGCSVIGIDVNEQTTTAPLPEAVLPEGGEIVLIGTPEGENKFLTLFAS